MIILVIIIIIIIIIIGIDKGPFQRFVQGRCTEHQSRPLCHRWPPGHKVRSTPTMFLWAKERPKSTIEYCFVDVYNYWTAYYDRSHVFYKIPGVPGTRRIHSLTSPFTTGRQHAPVIFVVMALPAKRATGGSFTLYHLIPCCSSPTATHVMCALQKKYLNQKQILKVPGKDVFANCCLSLLLQVTHLYIYNLSFFFQV